MAAIVDQVSQLTASNLFSIFWRGVVEGALNLLAVKIFFTDDHWHQFKAQKAFRERHGITIFERRVLVNKGREQKTQNQDAHESSGNEIFHGYK